MHILEVGQIVSLKLSNSPKMLVQTVLDEDSVVCVWFNSSNELQVETFNKALIDLRGRSVLDDLMPNEK